MDMIEQFGRVMFAVSSDQGGLIRSKVKDLLTEFQQFRSSLSHGSCCRGQGKTEWLGTVQVQAEETLRHFERLFLSAETMPARLTFGATFNPMRFNAQQTAFYSAVSSRHRLRKRSALPAWRYRRNYRSSADSPPRGKCSAKRLLSLRKSFSRARG